MKNSTPSIPLTFLVFAIVVIALGEIRAAERAATYKAALDRAAKNQCDIVVFQRGSDWSHLGEYLFARVWNRPELLKSLGDDIILVAVDDPEVPGNPSVSESAPVDAKPSHGKLPDCPPQNHCNRAKREIADNAAFTWRDICTPRIAFMDSQGRPVACENQPRQNMTVAMLANRIQVMQKARITRDKLWRKAEKATGAQQAEDYIDGLLLMDETAAFHDSYKPIRDKIFAADPKGEAGCSRRLMFPPEVRTVPPMVEAAYKLVEQKKFEEAITKIDAELRHPGNRKLTHENIQRIMVGKFNIYRRWPGHEEQRFVVQREILKFDPDTFWGIGAIGYLATFDKLPSPAVFTRGWAASDIKSGSNTWDYTYGLVPKHFDHAGKYRLRIIHRGGKDSVKIVRVTLFDGDAAVAKSEPNAILTPAGMVESDLIIPSWPPNKNITLRLELHANEHHDISGRFEVEPLL